MKWWEHLFSSAQRLDPCRRFLSRSIQAGPIRQAAAPSLTTQDAALVPHSGIIRILTRDMNIIIKILLIVRKDNHGHHCPR
jgi:hypothetical protein